MSSSAATPESFRAPGISTLPAEFTTVKLAGDETLSVHRALLTASSDNFAAALKGKFNEGSSNSLTLDDTDAKVFGCYVDWLYSGELFGSTPVTFANDFGTLCTIYIFGDRYHIPQFKRAVITRIIELNSVNRMTLAEDDIQTLFESLPSSDAMLNWALDEYLAQWHPTDGDIIKNFEGVHHDFLVKLINKMAEVTYSESRSRWRNNKNPCDYHAHKTDDSRAQCRAKGTPHMSLIPPPPPMQVMPRPPSNSSSSLDFRTRRARMRDWWHGLKRRYKRSSRRRYSPESSVA